MRPASAILALTFSLIGSVVFAQSTATIQRTSPSTAPASKPTSPLPASRTPSSIVSTQPLDSATADLTEYLSRLANLKDDDVDGHMDLARWARNHEMWSQAYDMAKTTLYLDPNNRAAYTILQLVDQARPLPVQPELESALKNEFITNFKHPFKTTNSRHFLLCYDTTDAFAQQRGVLMEKAYDAFQFYFDVSKLRPDFLDKRLVVILFKDHEDYLTYIRNTEHGDMLWSAGVYSLRSNRSAFFDDSSGPNVAAFNKQIETLKSNIDALNKRIAQASMQNQLGLANTLSFERNQDRLALSQTTSRMGTTINVMNDVKTLHEAAHQVAFNTNIQKRFVDYPLWFTEGLACSFETEDRQNGHRGPAVLNPGRIAGIKDALKSDALIPLEKFITQPPEKMDDAALSIFYSEAWGLFHYLYKFNRTGMETFLLAYKAHAPIVAIGPDERRKLFTDAFGPDVDVLQSRFFAYLRALPDHP